MNIATCISHGPPQNVMNGAPQNVTNEYCHLHLAWTAQNVTNGAPQNVTNEYCHSHLPWTAQNLTNGAPQHVTNDFMRWPEPARLEIQNPDNKGKTAKNRRANGPGRVRSFRNGLLALRSLLIFFWALASRSTTPNHGSTAGQSPPGPWRLHIYERF